MREPGVERGVRVRRGVRGAVRARLRLRGRRLRLPPPGAPALRRLRVQRRRRDVQEM